MKNYFKKTLWFALGFSVFLAIESVFYYAPKISVTSGIGSTNFLGGAIFIIWLTVLGFISARKNRYNWAVIVGANVAYILVSFSLKPVFISVVVLSLWQYAFRAKDVVYLSNDYGERMSDWNTH